MLIRESTPPLWVTQPAHAMVAGRIGSAWGNRSFPPPPLMEELIFAAGVHDIGYLDWELEPTLNAETGLPHTYMTLPHRVHLEIWRKGIRRLETVSRFAALMISFHSRGIYLEHFKPEGATQEDRERVEVFMKEQCDWQERVSAELLEAPRYAHCREIGTLAQYSHLLGTWDVLSLHLCAGGMTAATLIGDVPAGDAKGTLRLEPLDEENTRFVLEPWPFSEDYVNLAFEGRVMESRYSDTETLRKSIVSAPVKVVEVVVGKREGRQS